MFKRDNVHNSKPLGSILNYEVMPYGHTKCKISLFVSLRPGIKPQNKCGIKMCLNKKFGYMATYTKINDPERERQKDGRQTGCFYLLRNLHYKLYNKLEGLCLSLVPLLLFFSLSYLFIQNFLDVVLSITLSISKKFF